jgi:hypothetical protein
VSSLVQRIHKGHNVWRETPIWGPVVVDNLGELLSEGFQADAAGELTSTCRAAVCPNIAAVEKAGAKGWLGPAAVVRIHHLEGSQHAFIQMATNGRSKFQGGLEARGVTGGLWKPNYSGSGCLASGRYKDVYISPSRWKG